MELTREILCAYLPHEVKIKIPSTSSICTLKAVDIDGSIEVDYSRKRNGCSGQSLIYYDGKDRGHNEYIDNCKLILYPLSMLTQEIEHNGERFVPIVELAKMLNLWFTPEPQDYDADGNMIYGHTEAICEGEYLHFEFKYSEEHGAFCLYQDGRHNQPIDEFGNLKVFQYLHSLHFDLYGLIENGNAIDKSIK